VACSGDRFGAGDDCSVFRAAAQPGPCRALLGSPCGVRLAGARTHRTIIGAAALVGASLVVCADLIARVLGNVRNRDAAWRFVTSNWNRIVAQTTMSSGGGIVGASGSFCEASKADEVKEFFTTHTVASSERTLRQTLERIHTCSDLRSLQEANLANWLSQNPTTRAAD